MGREGPKMVKKRAQVKRLYDMLGKYSQVVQVTLANVTAAQFKAIHKGVRENKGELIVLKNSLFRKAVEFRIGGPDAVKHERYDWAKEFVTEAGEKRFEPLLPILKMQHGYIFTDEPIFELKPRIEGLTVPAAAKVGQEAQVDVIIPPGPSGMDPSQIGFFHALQITTKIVKGQIEIQKEYQVCTKGVPVTHSAVQLLKSMNIRPFAYGMKVIQMFDTSGEILDAAACSISPDDVIGNFQIGCKNIAAISLETGYATEVSVPYSIISAFKSVASIGVEIKYEFDFLKALQSSASSAPAQSAPTGGPAKQEAKKEEAPPEEEEDVDLGGGGLFGDDDDY